MDRSCIKARRFSPTFINGVKQFMQFVGDHFHKNDAILCPCRQCLNLKRYSQEVVMEHIHVNGMSSTYTRWIFHGESIDDCEDSAETVAYDSDEDIAEGDADYGDYDNDVPCLVEDLCAACNQGDGKQNIFSSLMDEAKRELYPGCSNFTRLSFLIKLLHIKSYNRNTNSAFTSLLELLNKTLPASNNLPKSYNEAKSVLREVGPGYESIHVRKYDCALFWKEHANSNNYPVCGTSRWKDMEGKRKVPHKVLRYFPIIPRLQRMLVNKEQSEHTRWHKEKRRSEENVMRHPADGEAWKDIDGKFEWFVQDPCNIRLGCYGIFLGTNSRRRSTTKTRCRDCFRGSVPEKHVKHLSCKHGSSSSF